MAIGTCLLHYQMYDTIELYGTELIVSIAIQAICIIEQKKNVEAHSLVYANIIISNHCTYHFKKQWSRRINFFSAKAIIIATGLHELASPFSHFNNKI